ncbi:hypothetical protein TRFO_30002 [Tritrichomonas foetus]|uniref:Uncharacterized protein n=1 Tax=Tritrichomonas foetus TaxID=1144522 RepID=A0A1J4JZS4_9EUKA|nr:hypothetical protein TRFO_30002 [Tritrichomonas foetus]|eukprot:OHT02757.1 hypothetical protein TRFO_30002 [Tritrichomonas foetus]
MLYEKTQKISVNPLKFMQSTPFTLHTSRLPTCSQKTKTQTRTLLTPRIPADMHRYSERDAKRKMANSLEKSHTVSNRLHLESAARRYRASDQDLEHFVWSRENISPKQTETMIESVDIFLNELKDTARSPDYPVIMPRVLLENEVPSCIATNSIRGQSPRSPRKVIKAFDRADYWKPHQKPLTAILPDLYITKRFQDFVYDRHEPIPDVLKQAPVAPPPNPNQNRRPKRSSELFVDTTRRT